MPPSVAVVNLKQCLSVCTEFVTYIFGDLRNRSDLAFAWLYQEYANTQGYNVLSASAVSTPLAASYDACLTRLLSRLLERREHKEGSVVAASY